MYCRAVVSSLYLDVPNKLDGEFTTLCLHNLHSAVLCYTKFLTQTETESGISGFSAAYSKQDVV